MKSTLVSTAAAAGAACATLLLEFWPSEAEPAPTLGDDESESERELAGTASGRRIVLHILCFFLFAITVAGIPSP